MEKVITLGAAELHGSTGQSSSSPVESIIFLQPPEKFAEAVLKHLARMKALQMSKAKE